MSNIQKRLHERAHVDPKASYDVTTPSVDVVAQTTDPMVFNEGKNSKASKLAHALGIFQSETLPALETVSKARSERHFQEGATDALLGKDRPSKGIMRLQGWDTLKGALSAKRDYRTEITDFYNENYLELTPDEFEAGMNEIAQRYLEGQSQSYVQSFIQNSLDIEQNIFDKYNETQRELFKQDSANMLSAKAHDISFNVVEEFIRREFEDILSLDEIRKRPDILWELSHRQQEFGYEVGKALRADLTEAQLIGKTLGFNRHDVNAIYLEQVGEIAVHYGLPELLSFFYMPDETGNAPIITTQNLGKPAYGYIAKAEASQKSILAEYKKALSDAEKQRLKDAEDNLKLALEAYVKDMNVELGLLEKMIVDNPEEVVDYADNLMYEMFQPESLFHQLDKTEHKKLFDRVLNVATTDIEFAVGDTDTRVYEELLARENEKSLTLDFLAEYKHMMSRKDWEEFTDKYYKQEQEAFELKQVALKNDVNSKLLQIKYMDSAEHRKRASLLFLEQLDNENPLFWTLDGNYINSIRDELLSNAKLNTIFRTSGNDDEAMKRLNSHKVAGTLTVELINEEAENITETTWDSFINDYMSQEEKKKREAEKEEEEFLKEQAEADSEAIEQRLKEYDERIAIAKLSPTSKSYMEYAEILDDFIDDPIMNQLDSVTRRNRLNEIIDSYIERRDYATDAEADDRLFNELLEQVSKGEITTVDLEPYLEAKLLSKSQHTQLILEAESVRKKDLADLKAKIKEQTRLAMQRQAELLRKAEEEAQYQREQAQEDFLMSIGVGITELPPRGIERSDAIRELKRQLQTTGRKELAINSNILLSEYNVLDKLERDIDKFPSDSKQDIVIGLELERAFGILDRQNLMELAEQDVLNQSDFLRYMDALLKQEKIEDEAVKEERKSQVALIKEFSKDLVNAIIGGDVMDINLNETDKKRGAKLNLNFQSALIEFEKEYNRPPTFDEWIDEIATPIVAEAGEDIWEVLKPANEIFNSWDFLTSKDFDKVFTETVTTGMFWFKSEHEVVSDPTMSLNDMEAFELFDKHFKSGLTRREVIDSVNKEWVNRAGRPAKMTPQAEAYYIENYANVLAGNYYINNLDPESIYPQAYVTREILDVLDDLGYSRSEALIAIVMGRHYFDETMNQVMKEKPIKTRGERN